MKLDRKQDPNVLFEDCVVKSLNKNGHPGGSVKKVAHGTQVHDMWPLGSLVFCFHLKLKCQEACVNLVNHELLGVKITPQNGSSCYVYFIESAVTTLDHLSRDPYLFYLVLYISPLQCFIADEKM